MAYVLSTNIVSPLGYTTEDNINALYEGKSSLQSYVGLWHLPETFVASLFSDEQRAEVQRSGYTLFESLCIESAQRALTDTDFDISAPDVLLILCYVLRTELGNSLYFKYQKDKLSINLGGKVEWKHGTHFFVLTIR